MIMTALLIASFLLLGGYTAAVCLKRGGAPDSLSATFYELKDSRWFTVCLGLGGFALLPCLMEASGEACRFLTLFASGGLVAVAIAPEFRSDAAEREVHCGGAALWLISSTAWVIFEQPLALAVWLPALAWITYNAAEHGSVSRAKPLFWAEVCSAAAVYVTALARLC